MYEHEKLSELMHVISDVSFGTAPIGTVSSDYHAAYARAVQLVRQVENIDDLAITAAGMKESLFYHLHGAAFNTLLALLEKIGKLHDQKAITDEQLAGVCLATCEVEREQRCIQAQLEAYEAGVCKLVG